jgi:hypothetical protein
MAANKTPNRRRYTDIIVLVLIGFCVVLIGVYQIQGAATYLVDQPQPTATRLVRPNSGFVPPTREHDVQVATLMPTSTAVPATPSPEATGDQEEDN